MASRELAKAARLVVDSKFEVVTGTRLDEVVDEVFREFVLVAPTT
jgi:hypothetical protein